MAETAKSPPPAQAASNTERLALTLDTSTGEIIKVENLDPGGQRRELSNTEKANLAKQTRGAGVEALLERAFEAGIACVLDDEDRKEDESETEDEAGVRRILLNALMERTGAARAMQKEILRQAIVQTLIQEVAGSVGSETEPPKAQKSDRSAPRAAT
jgi:hypothetical protein